MSMYLVDNPNSEHESDPSEASPEQRQRMIQYLLPMLKRGDVVAYKDHVGYRNSGKAIYDGNDIIALSTDVDDYGSVPPVFFIGDEFEPDHWSRDIICVDNISTADTSDNRRMIRAQDILYEGSIIDHNMIVWIDTQKHGKEIISNIKKEEGHNNYISFFNGLLGRFHIEIIESDYDDVIRTINAIEPLMVEAFATCNGGSILIAGSLADDPEYI